MAQATNGDTVRIHYQGTLDDGSVFDSSRERNPLEFTIGSGQVIEGFDKAAVGMSPGETKTVTIPAAEGYGPHRAEMVMEVDRARLPEGLDPSIGMRLQIEGGPQGPLAVTVTEVTDSSVTLDANHPLAGKDLTFELELVEIA